MARVDVAVVRLLASPQGHALLASLPPYDEADALSVQTRLRAEGHDPDLVAAALTQQRLRARAARKFGEFADGMLFTADGLEQATRLEVAAIHAERFADASLATVHDLGCGIGSDAMAMSVLGVTVAGVDSDAVTAKVADVNLRPWPDSRARAGRAEDVVLPTNAARDRVGVWLDPARRTPGVADIRGRTRRVFRLEDITPGWDFVLAVARDVPAVGAKLSPSLPHEAIPIGIEAQWTSWRGEVLEATMWWGPLARTLGRSALVMHPDRPSCLVTESMCDPSVPTLRALTDVGPWLYEPDRAVTQAGLIGAVTAQVGGGEVDAGLGYISSDSHVDIDYARRYAVHEAMPFNVKSLRHWLREHRVTGLTIKKRGIRTDEVALRSQLRIGRRSGDGQKVTIVLTRIGGRQAVLVVSPG